MSNHLIGQTSPYLLQHVNNPVDWYPWGKAAFDMAKKQDKPVFLSIGYSTCHWCHVMAKESFEDEEIALILNRYFISIKVDKEERADIDSIYMKVCQALSGSGGWPMSLFLTPEQKPFFAGTYFPKTARYNTVGFKELLLMINEKWQSDRLTLINYANDLTSTLTKESAAHSTADAGLIDEALLFYKQSFDEQFGGFGNAPKFPTAHNLLFLMANYEKSGDKKCLQMAEKTLVQMYRGGLFDHIGGGFCRYSTDRYFLIPHFEKMLYDNALLIMAYCKAFSLTEKSNYLEIAEKTANFIEREMTSHSGGFYSALDADSEGEEGKYYLFEKEEICEVLGEAKGEAFCRDFGIGKEHLSGKSIPNLLKNENPEKHTEETAKLYSYRKTRNKLHTDDKILTAGNALTIVSMCWLYRCSKNENYLNKALNAQHFIEKNLCEGNTLFASTREGRRGEKGFADDYAYYIFALISLYEATLEDIYLIKAKLFYEKVAANFYDEENGGFYFYSAEHEKLIMRPKETYDGAMPSGNSIMSYNMVRLNHIEPNEKLESALNKQLNFVSAEAKDYPAGFAMFLSALSDYFEPPQKTLVILGEEGKPKDLIFKVPLGSIIKIMEKPDEYFPLKNGKTTYYICRAHSCLPPINQLENEE